jgi:hypothetical protein
MKQQITLEQLNELKVEQLYKFLHFKEKIKHDDWQKNCPLPNIGQMIEFIGNGWYQKLSLDMRDNNDFLCDALWEVVRCELL